MWCPGESALVPRNLLKPSPCAPPPPERHVPPMPACWRTCARNAVGHSSAPPRARRSVICPRRPPCALGGPFRFGMLSAEALADLGARERPLPHTPAPARVVPWRGALVSLGAQASRTLLRFIFTIAWLRLSGRGLSRVLQDTSQHGMLLGPSNARLHHPSYFPLDTNSPKLPRIRPQPGTRTQQRRRFPG